MNLHFYCYQLFPEPLSKYLSLFLSLASLFLMLVPENDSKSEKYNRLLLIDFSFSNIAKGKRLKNISYLQCHFCPMYLEVEPSDHARSCRKSRRIDWPTLLGHSRLPNTDKSIRWMFLWSCASILLELAICSIKGAPGERPVAVTMASFRTPVPMFRSLAPRVAKDFFTCRQCLQNKGIATNAFRARFFTSLPLSKSSRVNSFLPANNGNVFSSSLISKRLTTVAATVEQGTSKTASSFPEVSSKGVAYWLLASAASVFGIVVFGGLTRLTESGYVCSGNS